MLVRGKKLIKIISYYFTDKHSFNATQLEWYSRTLKFTNACECVVEKKLERC